MPRKNEMPEIRITTADSNVRLANWAEIDEWAYKNVPQWQSVWRESAGRVDPSHVPQLLAVEMLRVYTELLKEHIDYVMKGAGQ